MPGFLTHGRSGPLAARLERLVERARAVRLDELSRRVEAGERGDVPACSGCGIFLLPGESGVCRHCAAGLPRTDPE
jgi:hypothetical protein